MTHFMPFHTHMALALQMLALVSGVLLFNKASSESFFCKKTGKIIGGLVTITMILSILCTFYLSIRSCCHKSEMGEWQHPSMETPTLPPPAGKK